jgi:hypothetical protein
VTLVAEAMPRFAEELERALREQGEPRLAEQVPGLKLVERCACGNESCRSFYTAMPMKRWFRRGRQVPVEGLPGHVVVDLIDGEIVYVEVVELG